MSDKTRKSDIWIRGLLLLLSPWLLPTGHILWLTGHKCLREPNGIIWFCGVGWQRRLRNMFIKEINSILKERSEPALMMTRQEPNDISLKFS